jgi:threonine/homoserine/homoserine lactone efflux protein
MNLPPLEHLVAFFTFSIVLLVVPGPAVLYIATRSATQGRRAGLVSVLGIISGGFLHVLAAAVGLSALLTQSAAAMQYVRWAGAAYLIYLGVQRFRSAGDSVAEQAAPEPQPLWKIYREGVVVNVLNPKMALFVLSFLPQFVDITRGPVAPQIIFLGSMFLGMAFVTDSIWAIAASAVGTYARKSKSARIAAYLSGGVYVGLGVMTLVGGKSSK